MISNSDIVEILELTGKLLELNDADEFRVRTYSSAAYSLDRFKEDLSTMTFSQLTAIQGVGKSMANTILEIVQTGTHKALEELLAKTPSGVLEMFKIKGIGAKKIKVIWQELGIDNLNDLQIACQNGKIAALKGFGEKIQTSILESMAFLQSQAGKLRMDKAAILAEIIKEELLKKYEKVEITGQAKRKSEIVDTLQFIVNFNQPFSINPPLGLRGAINEKSSSPFIWRGKFDENKIEVEILQVPDNQAINKGFIYSADEKHLAHRNEKGKSLLQITQENYTENEEQIYEKFGIPYIIPEMREGGFEFEWIKNHKNEDLITWQDLRGIVHNHSTYSDGKHSLEQMANYCRELGFEYLGIADHSQTATYAQGLLPFKVQEQHKEIDILNHGYLAHPSGGGKGFKILKGTESDILADGSLDYTDDILASFDYVVASVHQNLTMNVTKATDRLLRAIENPFTTILGHPTGRLLLSRQGYPIDYQAVINACAEHQVVIEINASPYRLDLDWRWIQYAVERGVMLSINPDAHEMQGYHDMNYGISVARKGGLTKDMTFNALSLVEVEAYLAKRRSKNL